MVIVGDVGLDFPAAPTTTAGDLRLSRSCWPPAMTPPTSCTATTTTPKGYVRWTEGRNIESFLELVDAGRIDPRPLVTHRFPFDRAEQAFELLTSDDPEGGRPIGSSSSTRVIARPRRFAERPGRGRG